MTKDEKFKLKRRNQYRLLFRKLFGGENGSLKLLLLISYFLGAMWVWSKQKTLIVFAESMELISPIFQTLLTHSIHAYLVVGGILLTGFAVYPFGRKAAQDQLQSIGLVNHAGMVPILQRKYSDRTNPHISIWEFLNQGIPLDIWESKRTAIEAALDITIIRMKYGKRKSHILLYTVSAQNDLPELRRWKDSYLSSDNFVLTLGEGFVGPVTVNLASIPHILLGGATGSGKSVLLKLLLMQALRKGAEVSIADFKGGVDFPPVWHKKCRMCFDEQELLAFLTKLVEELHRRKKLFASAGLPNIDQYNTETGVNLHRLIFACDEVAEMLDRTGLSKEQKELVNQIESRLATVARLGRAFGIHLILSTQRPDANLISGQIRNNLNCRICGRADNILSQLILDNTDAANQIPKDAKGRFMLHDGTVFQGYLFDEKNI
ncbi:hypothetical protein D1641_07570 [Colidextribacter sp. OB.20]|uniref:FtsK/SpoIIIE domain-containing protein n=1 Tax=Colidextribacter sp. OB.20 TaxID=2304568 RepID=UPI0013721C7D|nr:FtsK/SpoIIIE domain-containing protein [Colidextribacter sp. OB.20]NBI09874.1 hypothetical protein [Colidextribacter sp. OB.20]